VAHARGHIAWLPAQGELSANGGASRCPHDEVRLPDIYSGFGQTGRESRLPGDANRPAPTQYQCACNHLRVSFALPLLAPPPNIATMAQAAEKPQGLSRVLGLTEVTASGVGIIIGAGIYVLIGEAADQAGATLWLGFVLAALLSALTGLSYAELASMYPRAGAEYEYTRHAFPATVAFAVGWVMIAGLVVASGAVSIGFARYLGEFVAVNERVAAVLLMVAVAGVGLTGIKNSARATLVLSAIQVGGLLFVILVGFDHVGEVNLSEGNGLSGMLGAAALVFFAFIGFDEVITLSEETRNPAKTVPRALFAALAISAVLYVGVAIVAVSVLGAETLGASERPLADVVGHSLGGVSVEIVAAVALVSTFNTTLLALTAGSRLVYGMATGGALPRQLARLNRRHVPIAAVAFSTIAAMGFAMLNDLGLIASITDAAVYFVFLAVNASVVVLRFRSPELGRPFRVPFSILRVPLTPVLGAASTLLMLTRLEPRSLAIGLAVVASGLVVHFAVQLVRRRTPAARLQPQ
jgi:APA family basic amino acid/polyamine antiporter